MGGGVRRAVDPEQTPSCASVTETATSRGEIAAPAVDTTVSSGDTGAPCIAGLDRFEILDYLGAGGQGAVWRARDRVRDSEIAVKVLNRVAPDAVRRFKQEFRSLDDVQHPNLIQMVELFEID